MEYQIIPMAPCHVAGVAELEKICFTDPWCEAAVASELDNPLSLWLVAVSGDAVIGYVGSQSVLGEADMMNWAVCPACRRSGVARALLQALEEALRAKGVISLSLEVRQSNLAAQELYGSCGYGQVGLRPNYYRHPRENALILKKQWSAAI